MDFSRIFNVFSRRPQPAESPPKRLTQAFRWRVLRLCADEITDVDFWSEIRKRLQYLHGRTLLATQKQGESLTNRKDTNRFLAECPDEQFLDFVELIFQSRSIWRIHDDSDDLIVAIDEFFMADALPYHLTSFVYAQGATTTPYSTTQSRTVESYPQVIRRDSDILHETAIEPTLTLLSHPSFASANEEFLDALKDFRDGDYRDCVVKCGSSLESVMKVICDQKRWSYQQTDAAAKLLKEIIPRTTLDPFFEQPIMLIATVRNRLGKAHGAGTQQKAVPRHVASYVINATASVILLLVEESNP